MNNIYIYVYIYIYIYIYILIYIYIYLAYNGSSSKISFLIFVNSLTSVEFTAVKMQNLPTKQEPEGAYNTDLYELQKQIVT